MNYKYQANKTEGVELIMEENPQDSTKPYIVKVNGVDKGARAPLRLVNDLICEGVKIESIGPFRKPFNI